MNYIDRIIFKTVFGFKSNVYLSLNYFDFEFPKKKKIK